MTTTEQPPVREKLRLGADWAILGTFAYLLMIPVGNTPILLVAVLLMAVASLFIVVTERRGLVAELRMPAILSGLLLALGVVVGIGNEGWAHSLIAWAATPILFWTWAAALSFEMIRKLLWIAVWATIALSGITFLIALTGPTGLPDAVIHPIFGGNSSGFGFGAIIAIYGTSTLMATAPMWVTGALLPKTTFLPDRAWMIAAAASSLLATVVSSRRATVVLAIVIPLVVLALYWLTRDRSQPVVLSKRARWITLAGVGVFVLAVVASSFTRVVQRTFLGLVSIATGQSQTQDEYLRFEQIPKLWDGFLRSPIWGNGIGATLDGYVRHELRPWVFEMQYNMILFQVGVVGALLLLGAVVLVIRALWRAVKARPDLRPVFAVTTAAALSIIVGNALNPILQAPGHFWSVFLLIGLINAALRDKEPAAF